MGWVQVLASFLGEDGTEMRVRASDKWLDTSVWQDEVVKAQNNPKESALSLVETLVIPFPYFTSRRVKSRKTFENRPLYWDDKLNENDLFRTDEDDIPSEWERFAGDKVKEFNNKALGEGKDVMLIMLTMRVFGVDAAFGLRCLHTSRYQN